MLSIFMCARAFALTVVSFFTFVAVLGVSLSPGVLDSVPWIIAKVVIASESYTMNGGTSAFSLVDGPDEVVRKYSDCKESDEAAICESCAAVALSSTVCVVMAFIFSVMATLWSFYEIFSDTTDDSSNFQLIAIAKKGCNIIFAICALVTFQDCYDGMVDDDDVIKVKSYEYGTGVVSLIVSILLTVLAGILSVVVLYMKRNSDAQVGDAKLEEMKQQKGNKKKYSAQVSSSEVDLVAFANHGELDCNHTRHKHGFDHENKHHDDHHHHH